MPPNAQRIDAISVGVGLDLHSVRGDILRMQGEIRRAVANPGQAIRVPVHIFVPTEDLRKLQKNIARDVQGAGRIEVPVSLGDIRVNQQDFRNFRRTVERQMRGFSQNGTQGIHVPIQVANLQQFRTSIERALQAQPIEVKTRWGGWEGGAPPSGSTSGPSNPPAGSGPRRGPGPAPAGGAPTPGPTPTRSNPTRGRAQQSAAPSAWEAHEAASRQAAMDAYHARTASTRRSPGVRRGVETSSSDRYEVQDEPVAAPPPPQRQRARSNSAESRRQNQRVNRIAAEQDEAQASTWTADGGASPIVEPVADPRAERRQRRASQRQQRAQQAAYGPPRPEAPLRTPPPAGGRVSVDELRFQRPEEQLQGEERAAYIAQRRANPRSLGSDPADTAPRFTPRSGFRATARGGELLAQRRHRQDLDAWLNSDAAKALPRHPDGEIDIRALQALGFDGSPAVLDAITDPEAKLDMEGLRELKAWALRANRQRFGAEGREGAGRTGIRQVRRARKRRQGRVPIENISPTDLIADAAVDATFDLVQRQTDPLYGVQAGDNKRRGKGGKVGQRGGINAGRLASESIDIDAVQEIIERRGIGGQGNGWKALQGEFSRPDIARARAIINERRERPPAEPVVEGQAYGGFLDESRNVLVDTQPMEGGGTRRVFQQVPLRPEERPAPSIQGGQGISRKSPRTDEDVRREEANRQAQKRERETFGAPAPTTSPGPARNAGFSAGQAGAFPGHSGEGPGGFGRTSNATEDHSGRPRMNRPPQNMGAGPTPRAEEVFGAQRVSEDERAQRDRMRQEELDRKRAEREEATRARRAKLQEEADRKYREMGPAIKGMSRRRSAALWKMAHAQESPSEMEVAREQFRKKGIDQFLFAEGGVPDNLPPWRLVQAYTRYQGQAPRRGSRMRSELDERYLRGMREREKRAKKPRYQQGGSSDPLWAKTRKRQLSSKGWCASCGTTGTPDNPLAVDHIVDVASGGDRHDPGNLQTLCRRCNGRKSGGRSARPIETPYRNWAPGADPWGPERMSFEDEMGFDRRAEGGLMRRLREGPPAQLKSTGLLDRSADTDVTIVGERGAEGIVTDRNTGESHVVPAHKLPMWLARAQEGKGLAKDLTHRAEGGPLKINRAGRYYSGNTLLSADQARTGDVQRVFVVNWPPAGAYPAQGRGHINQPNPTQGRAQSPGAGTANASAPPDAGEQPFAPSGAPRPGSSRRVPPNPAAAGEARRTARFDPDVQAFEERILGSRAQITESLQEAPVRALSVAFGQIAQTAIGGRAGILRRAREAGSAAQTAGQEQQELRRLIERREAQRQIVRDIDSGTTDITPDRRAEARADAEQLIGRFNEAIESQTRVTERAVLEAEARAKGGSFIDEQGQTQRTSGILTRGQQFRAQAVGLGGIVAGTQAFTMTVAALSAAEQAASAALGPLIDQMRGWPATIDRVTAAVRENMQVSAGNQRQGLAQAFGATGVSAAFLDQQGGAVGQVGVNRAAQMRAQQALDLTRAAAGALPSQGMYEGIGGLFGSNFATEVFGGQPGFLQTIAKRLSVNAPGLNTGPADGGLLGLFPNDRARYQDNQRFLRENTTNGQPNFLVSPGDVTQARNEVRAFESAESGPQRQLEVIADLNKNLEAAANYAGEAADAFRLVPNASKELTDAMVKSAEATGDAGAIARARDFAAAGVGITRGGRALGVGDFSQYAEAQARGQLIDDPSVLLRQTENERRAQAQLLRSRAEATRQQDIPAQFAFESIASPSNRPGTSYSTVGLYGADAQADVEKYRGIAVDTNKQIAEGIDEGRKALYDIVGQAGPQALREFTGIFAQVGKIGTDIRDINESIQIRQVNLETKQYTEQLRLANRSLGDAQDFYAGIQGAVADTVGGLQGQNALLDRQNQLLGRRQTRLGFKSQDIGFKQSDLQYQLQQIQFAASQRQINFGVAVAGFTAPGTTPAERAARIEEAKLEAAEAQKQLDLQIEIAEMGREQLAIAKEQLEIAKEQNKNAETIQDNQFLATTKEAERAVVDLQKQLDLLRESRSVTIETSAAEEAIGRLQKQQGRLVSQAQAYVQEGQEVRNNVLEDAARLQSITGRAFSELIGQVNRAWDEAFDGYETRWRALMGNVGVSGGTGGASGGSTRTQTPSAAGVITNVNTPTRFIAGDAGNESVIVIRNPQAGMIPSSVAMSGGGGGGGGTFNFYIQGGAGMDEDAIAQKVAWKVAQIQDRRFGMLVGSAG